MNVPCHNIRELLDDFLDGDLSRSEKSKIKRHLKGCPECRSELMRQRKTENYLKRLPLIHCPDSVIKQIERLTFGNGEGHRKYRRFSLSLSPTWRWVPVGLAATAVIILLIFYPSLERDDPGSVSYSQEEVMEAKNKAKWSLAYIAKTVNRTEREVVENVLLKDVPKTLRKSIRKAVPILQGGQ